MGYVLNSNISGSENIFTHLERSTSKEKTSTCFSQFCSVNESNSRKVKNLYGSEIKIMKNKMYIIFQTHN